MNKLMTLVATGCLLVGAGCCPESSCSTPESKECSTMKTCWESTLAEKLPLLGHRNWILVVDKAYPAQSANGIDVLYTGKPMSEVLPKVIEALKESTHVAPIYYVDKELEFIPEVEMPGVSAYRTSLAETLKGTNPKQILHNDVFPKIDAASKLFNVLVIKTDETIAYSSVFIELDCKYWGPKNEAVLRDIMKK